MDHIDSDYTNNILSNLRWATPVENMNNENTIKKLSRTIEVTHPNKNIEIIIGIFYVAKKLKMCDTTVTKYLENGKSYKGYSFKEII